jgi:hypothetical protein
MRFPCPFYGLYGLTLRQRAIWHISESDECCGCTVNFECSCFFAFLQGWRTPDRMLLAALYLSVPASSMHAGRFWGVDGPLAKPKHIFEACVAGVQCGPASRAHEHICLCWRLSVTACLLVCLPPRISQGAHCLTLATSEWLGVPTWSGSSAHAYTPALALARTRDLSELGAMPLLLCVLHVFLNDPAYILA